MSYGKAGTEQNWSVLTLTPPRQLLDPGAPRRNTMGRHCACSNLNADIPLLCFPISPSQAITFFTTPWFTWFFPPVSPDLTKPGKNPPRLRSASFQNPSRLRSAPFQNCQNPPRLRSAPFQNPPRLRSAPFQSCQSSMGSACGDVGSAVTDARAGTTTQTLPPGTGFVLCSGTTGTVPLQRKRMLK